MVRHLLCIGTGRCRLRWVERDRGNNDGGHRRPGGGPGGETLAILDVFFADAFLPFLRDRDLVIFDQRGVGLSEPSLVCPEIRQLSRELLDDDLSAATLGLELEAWRRCRDRLLAEGVDLSAYNSAASAADVVALRTALGYESWNLLGVANGSRLELTVMRDDPDGVRAVVLDSAYPPHRSTVKELPANFDRALGVLFAGCAQDAGRTVRPHHVARLGAIGGRDSRQLPLLRVPRSRAWRSLHP